MSEVIEDVADMKATADRRMDMLETAWGVIANAMDPPLGMATSEWRLAAERWRDEWHAELALVIEATELEPEVEPQMTGHDPHEVAAAAIDAGRESGDD